MQSIITGLKGFIIGFTITWVLISIIHMHAMNKEIQQLKQEKISGWGND